ncbi:hypothetical protein EDD17DRAFT_1514798 [Pisolithus thermaeus]|nr:hypothetical protein EV401DRAFT_1895855 [Pisolithus croceorrhizus]KAI6146070.1 hypothetical protein EDD17DRAFT_1514798 [Pisolithus thermaeus]
MCMRRGHQAEFHTAGRKQAEKERELANIEQHYARLKRSDNGLDSGLTLPKGHEGEGRGEAASGTQDNQLDSPPVSAMVEVVTKSVEMALCSLLESGGHFSVGAIPQSPRQENHKLQLEKAMEPSYQRNFILAEVHHLFKEKLKIEQDINFITHEPAEAADVHAYEYKDGPDADTDNLPPS